MKRPILILTAILAVTAPPSSQARIGPSPELPNYNIFRASDVIHVNGSADEPDWNHAAPIEFVFPWNDVAKESKQGTIARMLWDDTNLYIIYVCDDPYLHSQVTEHDGPVYEEDAVEIFATPNTHDVTAYYGYEMNINGTLLDYIAFDAGEHRTKSIHFAWQSEGVQIATSFTGTLNDHTDIDQGWILEIAIPLDNFRHLGGQIPPTAGDVWRLNLNRTKGYLGQFSQWSNTQSKEPSFHHANYFGKATFINSSEK